MSYDNVCKIIAEKYPFDFARWLLPVEPRKIKVLKTELSIEPIRADSVKQYGLGVSPSGVTAEPGGLSFYKQKTVFYIWNFKLQQHQLHQFHLGC